MDEMCFLGLHSDVEEDSVCEKQTGGAWNVKLLRPQDEDTKLTLLPAPADELLAT